MPKVTDANWWADALGVRRDPTAEWRWDQPVERDATMTRGLTLTSFETTLTARLALPAEGADQIVVLPFYEVESLFGEPYARGADRNSDERSRRAYGRQLLRRGAGVLAVPWWCEVEALRNPTPGVGLEARYGGPAADHRRRAQEAPGRPVSGLGRSVGDLLSAVDALESLIDQGELGAPMITAFGHSLGGKLALVLTALDPRIRGVVIHELGLGFEHSNWEDSWYLDGQIPDGHDLDELLALIAPRPCLYGGGEAFDGGGNRHLAESAAQRVGRSDWLRIVTHDNGHTPPTEFLEDSYRWLLDLRS